MLATLVLATSLVLHPLFHRPSPSATPPSASNIFIHRPSPPTATRSPSNIFLTQHHDDSAPQPPPTEAAAPTPPPASTRASDDTQPPQEDQQQNNNHRPPQEEPQHVDDEWQTGEPIRLVSKKPLEELTDDDFDAMEEPVNRVLVIYTGGTLGMTLQNGTLAPLPGELQKRIVEMPEVHAASMPELDFIEYDPPIDSSNISPQDWARLAKQIGDNYYDYDGFVILHGTDTMAYTASALSFMLENLGKAVVLTGSMIPLAEVYNDARRNLIISIVFAAQLELCEVAIFFDDRLLRGSRASKIDSGALTAFDSPNFPPLATVGASINAEMATWRAPPMSRLRVHTKLDTNLVCMQLAPGFDDSAILAMVRHAPSLKGLVLSLYGTGNGPAHKAEFISVIEEAIQRGILVVAVTQCTTGAVSLETYEVGRALLDLGVISAGDMTTEAVVTKVAYLLGRRVSPERMRQLMYTDLRGERTARPTSSWNELSSLSGQIPWAADLARLPTGRAKPTKM